MRRYLHQRGGLRAVIGMLWLAPRRHRLAAIVSTVRADLATCKDPKNRSVE